MNNDFIQIIKVSKKFEAHQALLDVDLTIPKGTVFGLLGPNGAGKTTLIRCITQIIQPDTGSISINGETLNQAHIAQVGYMPEERGLYKKMKVGEQLMYLAQLKGLKKTEAKEKIAHWLQKFEIETWYNKKVEELSKGMQQKIQFISTIINKPPLLILDEPFTGLDPINAKLIQDEIEQLKNEGITIIFSTHRMEQVEEICSQMALINLGKNILSGNVNDIKQQFKKHHFVIKYSGDGQMLAECPFQVVENGKGILKIALHQNQTSNDFLKWMMNQPVQIESFYEQLPTISEIFIQQVETNV